MAVISQTTFSIAFSWMKIFEFRPKFYWSLSLRVQLTILQRWFRHWLGAVRPCDKPLSEQMMVRLPTHICVTRPQWVNTTEINAIYKRDFINPRCWGNRIYSVRDREMLCLSIARLLMTPDHRIGRHGITLEKNDEKMTKLFLMIIAEMYPALHSVRLI